jgi:hypothetical protein
MYYEEKFVNGEWCFRVHPKGVFIPLSLEMLQKRITELKQQLKILNIPVVTNLVFSGIGYCGMSKDMIVKGKLTEANKQHDHAILTDERGMPHAVIYKTLKTCW